ncbi:MAG: hypothetical protein HOG49_02455, partial [Candidatus Scalindua sp.]|nr:hypothetical protein [Candidatus Scalindua sp.]
MSDADDAAKKANLVLTDAIADNASGSAEAVATVTGLNTDAFSAVGSLVYESLTAGEFTETAPTDANDDRRVVGVIKVKSATVGEIYFFPGKGGLELANVYMNNITPGTAKASGALIVDANIDVAGIRNIGCTNIDAGLSGTAGSVDIFPATGSKGKVAMTTSNNSGDTTTGMNFAAQTGARTLTVPDGGQATASFLLTEGAQTIAGVQTYSAPQVIDANTAITAFNGGGQGSAVALTGEFNNVTTVTAAFDSVKLLTAVAGQVQVVKNSGASILSVFPSDADSINALAINLSVDIPVGGQVTFRAISDTVWETQEVFYSSSPTTQTGGLAVYASANAANTDVSVTNASHGQATVVTIPDSGLATAYLAQSTNALTVAEVDVLDAVTPGTASASKALIVDSNIDIGTIRNLTATGNLQGATASIVATVRPTSDYAYFVEIDCDEYMTGGVSQKTYMLGISGERPVGSAATLDSNDAIIKGSYSNYAVNDANFIIRGINTSVTNRGSAELGMTEGAAIGASNKSAGVSPTLRGM